MVTGEVVELSEVEIAGFFSVKFTKREEEFSRIKVFAPVLDLCVKGVKKAEVERLLVFVNVANSNSVKVEKDNRVL